MLAPFQKLSLMVTAIAI